MSRKLARPAAAQRGFSLIELMVSVAIGLIVTLAITGVLVASEQQKRSSTSVNDVNQTGAYLSYVLDRAIRSAGSGFSEKAGNVFGCTLSASLNTKQILPAATLPAPFAGFAAANPRLRVAPVVVARNQSDTGSDVLMVMTGNGGFAETAARVGAATDATTLALPNTLTLQASDLLLLAGGGPNCLVTQVQTTPPADAQSLALGGAYFASEVAGASVASFGGGSSLAIPLGNAATRPPLFQLFGVGANNALVSYDLLQVAGATPVPIADGVVMMRALYGVSTAGNPITWIKAENGALGDFSAAGLMNGTEAALANLQRIVAVRVGLVLRTQREERNDVAPAELVLFQDLAGLSESFKPGTDGVKFRFRTIEATVPVRNTLL